MPLRDGPELDELQITLYMETSDFDDLARGPVFG